MVRKQAIDEEGIDDDQDEREEAGDAEGILDGNALVDGVRVLEGVIAEGEVLVIWFKGVEDPEADDAGTVQWLEERLPGGGRPTLRSRSRKCSWKKVSESGLRGETRTYEMTTRGRSGRLENGNLAGISIFRVEERNQLNPPAKRKLQLRLIACARSALITRRSKCTEK
jgi:hypothetical protein